MMSDDSTLTDSSVEKVEVAAKKPKIRSKVDKRKSAVVKKVKDLPKENSEDEEHIAPEKVKNAKKAGTKKTSNSLESSDDELEKDETAEKSGIKRERDHQGNQIVPIGGNRFVSVDRFKGRVLIGIREYYQKDGKWFPGKKGISLHQDQYETFLKIQPDVKKMLTSI